MMVVVPVVIPAHVAALTRLFQLMPPLLGLSAALAVAPHRLLQVLLGLMNTPFTPLVVIVAIRQSRNRCCPQQRQTQQRLPHPIRK